MAKGETEGGPVREGGVWGEREGGPARKVWGGREFIRNDVP